MHDRQKATRRTVVLGAAATCVATAAAGVEAIVQPAERQPQDFMARALAMRDLAVAQGDQSYEAVVVFAGSIVAERPSAVVTAGDPTAHAEMGAIRDARRRLGRTSLAGAVLYSSSRPCPMCEAEAARAGIARMIHGERMTDAGPPRP